MLLFSFSKSLGLWALSYFQKFSAHWKITITTWGGSKSSNWFQNNSTLNKLFTLKLSSSFEDSTLDFILRFLCLCLVLFVTGIMETQLKTEWLKLTKSMLQKYELFGVGQRPLKTTTSRGVNGYNPTRKHLRNSVSKALKDANPLKSSHFTPRNLSLRKNEDHVPRFSYNDIHSSPVYNSKTNKIKHRNAQQ